MSRVVFSNCASFSVDDVIKCECISGRGGETMMTMATFAYLLTFPTQSKQNHEFVWTGPVLIKKRTHTDEYEREKIGAERFLSKYILLYSMRSLCCCYCFVHCSAFHCLNLNTQTFRFDVGVYESCYVHINSWVSHTNGVHIHRHVTINLSVSFVSSQIDAQMALARSLSLSLALQFIDEIGLSFGANVDSFCWTNKPKVEVYMFP